MAPTPLVFLPGAGGDPGFWRPLGDRLPGPRKIYLDWPGLGNQPPAAEVNGLEDLVRRVEAALPPGPVDLLAQSMGGVVALLGALRHPQRVRRLVLVATSGGLEVAALGAEDWRPAYRAAFPQAAPWILDTHVDLSARLAEITIPTLLVWGDTDPISPVPVGRALAARLPNSTLHLVPGGDHDLVHTHASIVAPVIAAFLGGFPVPGDRERVSLRPVETADLPVFFEHQRDPIANQLAAFPPREREAFMTHWQTRILGNPAARTRTILWAGEVVGNIGAWTDAETDERLLGYWIGREFWGRGIASAAVAHFLMEETARPITAHVVAHNVGSIRVLEKCGFKRRGEETHPSGDGGTLTEFIYVLSA